MIWLLPFMLDTSSRAEREASLDRLANALLRSEEQKKRIKEEWLKIQQHLSEILGKPAEEITDTDWIEWQYPTPKPNKLIEELNRPRFLTPEDEEVGK